MSEYAHHYVRQMDLQTGTIVAYSGQNGVNAFPTAENLPATSHPNRHVLNIRVSPYNGDVYIGGRFYSVRRVFTTRNFLEGTPSSDDIGTTNISLQGNDGTYTIYDDFVLEVSGSSETIYVDASAGGGGDAGRLLS